MKIGVRRRKRESPNERHFGCRFRRVVFGEICRNRTPALYSLTRQVEQSLNKKEQDSIVITETTLFY